MNRPTDETLCFLPPNGGSSANPHEVDNSNVRFVVPCNNPKVGSPMPKPTVTVSFPSGCVSLAKMYEPEQAWWVLSAHCRGSAGLNSHIRLTVFLCSSTSAVLTLICDSRSQCAKIYAVPSLLGTFGRLWCGSPSCRYPMLEIGNDFPARVLPISLIPLAKVLLLTF
jgi:hypothetical protein